MKRRLFTFSLCINVLFVAFIIAYFVHRQQFQQSVQKESYSVHSGWDTVRNGVYDLYPVTAHDIVFVGTSLTALFPLNELFHSIPIKNRGVEGNTVKNINYRIDAILQAHPKKLFIEGGVNDILMGIPADTTLHYYQNILSCCQRTSPQTIIYVQSLLPFFNAKASLNPSVQFLNKRVRSLCAKYRVHYIDLYSGFIFPGIYSVDGIHVNASGYRVWVERIKNEVSD